jgi:hypothetical protein
MEFSSVPKTVIGIAWRIVSAVMLLAAANAQTVVTNPLRGLAEAYMEAYRLKSQIDTGRAMQDLLHAQAEATRAETERIRRQRVAVPPADAGARQDAAIAAVKSRYPDFGIYVVEAVRLMNEFNSLPQSGVYAVEHYVEALYLLAKYASFSSAARPSSESPAALLASEPEFHKIPIESRIRLLRAVDPEFKTIKDSELEAGLKQIAERVLGPAVK